jgi:para-aminobenzoate synthetase component 1
VTIGRISAKDSAISCKIHHRKITSSVSLHALNELFSSLKEASILGGNISRKKADGFSCWAAHPKEVFEFQAGQKNPFEKLQAVLGKYKLEKYPEDKLPKGMFCGGWIGYFGYELGRFVEQLPERNLDDLKMPLIRLCFYDKAICYDHKEKVFWLIALEMSDDIEGYREKLDSLEQQLVRAERMSSPQLSRAEIESVDFSRSSCNMAKNYYLEQINKIKRYIYDGQVYQVNFSQRFEKEFYGRPIDLFHWQNTYNPSGYAAYIDTGDSAIVSASPEMFITISDGVISTKPIKGTRPRKANQPIANKQNFDELVKSEKEQAELNMIVDLERNDLARICKPGTRKVVQPRSIESFPTVFHAVATVAGELRDEATFCEVLKAMFPGGSITGAPKISAMEIIDETEPTARGVYTGSIGFIGIDNSVCLNIAIRTVIIINQKAYIQTGGGIVADSEPEAEWRETLTKARALLAGIEATNGILKK